MTTSTTFDKFEPFERDPVLSDRALEIMRKAASDPKLAAEFLKGAGIMDENGQLAAPYRIQEWERELMAPTAPEE